MVQCCFRGQIERQRRERGAGWLAPGFGKGDWDGWVYDRIRGAPTRKINMLSGSPAPFTAVRNRAALQGAGCFYLAAGREMAVIKPTDVIISL